MTSVADMTGLRREMTGDVITPEDSTYEERRALYNAMIDRRPALIARCRSVSDVQSALQMGKDAGLPIAIRGGGHNGAGFGTVEDGLVIDLGPMNEIDIDPENRTARVGAGATWGEVDRATHQHGLATVSGIVGTTGVAGLTLGGGHGHLSRKHGLTIDNLLAAEMVLADGRSVTASDDENSDLFWAIRGGGGNFGIVTSFTFRLHPVKNVIWGPTAWPISETTRVLEWYRDFLPAAHDDVYGYFALLTVPPVPEFPEEFHMHKACGIVWCFTGDPADADEALAPVRELEPAFDGVQEVPYPVAQSAFDELYPTGLQWYWKGDFIREIPDGAVAEHVKYGEMLPTMHSGLHVYPIDGAVNRVDQNETAFAYRDANWSQVIVAVDPDPSKADELKVWARNYWEALQPYSAGGTYVNFMMDEGQERVQATYGPNYQKLTEIKAKYDPDNLFRINQNIKPAG